MDQMGDEGEEVLEALTEPQPASPTPHGDKLRELLRNVKLPEGDAERVEATLSLYESWLQDMERILAEEGIDPDQRVAQLAMAVSDYKRAVEVDLIWDSPNDFLHRQRGQIKLESSIIEEFLPKLVTPAIVPGLEGKAYEAGPRRTFSAAYFETTLASVVPGGGLQVRTKDHDFAVGRPVFLAASWQPDFPAGDTVTHSTFIAFVAAECKTNLDKTMFQEAAATAHDLKVAIPGAKDYLICEWLDMTPISTAATDLDEVIILRGKRLPSNIRVNHSTYEGRQDRRSDYVDYLENNPIRAERILRFVGHLRALFGVEEPGEEDVLTRGYF